MTWRLFEKLAERYDGWYDRNQEKYAVEVECLRGIFRNKGISLEVGVGTGRFAEFCHVGIDASLAALKIARKRVQVVVRGDACNLPFKEQSFDSVLFIFTLCFLESPEKALKEAWRVLKKDGAVYVLAIPLDSPLGQKYSKTDSLFYRAARFFTFEELKSMLERNGFRIDEVKCGFIELSDRDLICISASKD
jgi:ubiquinone/menaquinone biosynthesis C-methylase UbiE